jgi:MED6 mediator sub complex component
MSDTASFVDPVFLARFGLARVNVLDYFLHPLNPFRTKANTSNEILSMQGIGIGMLMQYGTNGEPMTPVQAEDEYNNQLKRLTGEQYQLMPPNIKAEDKVNSITLNQMYLQPSQLYVIRHVVRTSVSSVKVLGIYYIVEGIIYKSPSVRSVCKTNVARTLHGLAAANEALSVCARYLPSTGYTWVFEDAQAKFDDIDDSDSEDDSTATENEVESDDKKNSSYLTDGKRKKKTKISSNSGMNPVELYQLCKKRKRRKVLDHRRPGERTAAEEEGIRASESIDQILVRLSKSHLVTGALPKPIQSSATNSKQNMMSASTPTTTMTGK